MSPEPHVVMKNGVWHVTVKLEHEQPCGCQAPWIGMAVKGVYDLGVLFWQCEGCGKAFQRWHGRNALYEKAQGYIDAVNGGAS